MGEGEAHPADALEGPRSNRNQHNEVQPFRSGGSHSNAFWSIAALFFTAHTFFSTNREKSISTPILCSEGLRAALTREAEGSAGCSRLMRFSHFRWLVPDAVFAYSPANSHEGYSRSALAPAVCGAIQTTAPIHLSLDRGRGIHRGWLYQGRSARWRTHHQQQMSSCGDRSADRGTCTRS
jgi:hypothetical protein